MRNLDPGDESLALAKHLLNNQCNEIKKRGNQVANYIKDIRSKVGHMRVLSSMTKDKYYCNSVQTREIGVYPVA